MPIKYLSLAISFYIAFSLNCDAQESADNPAQENQTDSVTHINPNLFPFGKHVFKRVENKAGKKMYKLGLKSDKLYVIDAKGNVQPFTFISCNLLIPVNAGNAVKKIQNRKLSNVVKEIFTQAGVGVKFTFENIVIQDNSGKQMTGLVEPLQMVKIK